MEFRPFLPFSPFEAGVWKNFQSSGIEPGRASVYEWNLNGLGTEATVF